MGTQRSPCPRFPELHDMENTDIPHRQEINQLLKQVQATFTEPNKSQSGDYKGSFDECASSSSPSSFPLRSSALTLSGHLHLAETRNLVILYLARTTRVNITRAAVSPVNRLRKSI